MKRIIMWPLRLIGSALRATIVGVLVLGIASSGIVFADYFATVPGSGTTFASLVIAAKHYAAMVICDPTAGESQCAGVDASNNLKVIVTAIGTTVPVSGQKSATGTQAIVASSASSVTVLASNSNRLGATVFNDSTAVLYLLLSTGGTASATVYTVQLQPNSYYEVPFNYTGALIGIWASANGNARVTEFT